MYTSGGQGIGVPSPLPIGWLRSCPDTGCRLWDYGASRSLERPLPRVDSRAGAPPASKRGTFLPVAPWPYSFSQRYSITSPGSSSMGSDISSSPISSIKSFHFSCKSILPFLTKHVKKARLLGNLAFLRNMVQYPLYHSEFRLYSDAFPMIFRLLSYYPP